jgi:hypothetical protein
VRPLTPNEKLLLTVLVLIVFAGANFFGYRMLKQKKDAQTLDYAEARADQAEAKVSLLQKSTWEKRESWIAAHEPTATEEGDAQAATLQFVSSGARSQGLQVVEQSLNETVESGNGFRVEVALTVKGPMHALTQWLAGLQDPASFYAVPYLSLKADDEQKSMVGNLHIYRFFKRAKS